MFKFGFEVGKMFEFGSFEKGFGIPGGSIGGIPGGIPGLKSKLGGNGSLVLSRGLK